MGHRLDFGPWAFSCKSERLFAKTNRLGSDPFGHLELQRGYLLPSPTTQIFCRWSYYYIVEKKTKTWNPI